MHSRKKGKSKSHKHASKMPPSWVKQSKEEVAGLVQKMAKEGKRAAAIGLELRDQYGIPSIKAVTGKTISQVLKEKKMAPEYPDDLMALIRRAVGLRKHLKTNTRDTSNKQKLGHVESKIKRLVAYYRGNKLPANWKYVPEEAALLVK